MGGPLVVGAAGANAGAGATGLGRMSAEQVIAQISRYEASSSSNTYALGVCLRELSQAKRYREELGFETFEELLVERKLPSRMTAFKLIAVVSTYSEKEVAMLGGTEKSYALVRFAKRQGSNSDPRKFLAPNARLLGRFVSILSANDINAATRDSTGPNAAQHAAAKKASSRLGRALARAEVPHHMRVHNHRGVCVSTHMDAAAANQLCDLLARLRKLEKQVGDST